MALVASIWIAIRNFRHRQLVQSDQHAARRFLEQAEGYPAAASIAPFLDPYSIFDAHMAGLKDPSVPPRGASISPSCWRRDA